MIAYDLETLNTEIAIPYSICIYTLSKISGKNYCDITNREYEKGRKDSIVFKETDNNNEMLDYVLQFKGKSKRVNNEVGKHKLYLIAHNSSGFDSYLVLNNLPQWRTVVSLIKNGSGIVSLKRFNGYIDQNKKVLSVYILDVEEFISTIH